VPSGSSGSLAALNDGTPAFLSEECECCGGERGIVRGEEGRRGR